ncbi:hypothetical protein K0M31_018917 [Melipona bicolor]|uniref:Uncharacterized protein n=1 Tax=Melipona bicolor TaxID=60889 RepID=A0AA40KSD6_9HYME|nr:hypothetical protein K0M31_018917 [Melipona bicolor]
MVQTSPYGETWLPRDLNLAGQPSSSNLSALSAALISPTICPNEKYVHVDTLCRSGKAAKKYYEQSVFGKVKVEP